MDYEFPLLNIIIHLLVLPPRCCPVPASCWIWEDLQTKRSSICCIFYQVDNAAQKTNSSSPASSQPGHALQAARVIPAPCESHFMKPSRKNVQEAAMKQLQQQQSKEREQRQICTTRAISIILSGLTTLILYYSRL